MKNQNPKFVISTNVNTNAIDVFGFMCTSGPHAPNGWRHVVLSAASLADLCATDKANSHWHVSVAGPHRPAKDSFLPISAGKASYLVMIKSFLNNLDQFKNS